jgi:predicted phosphodiesterase
MTRIAIVTDEHYPFQDEHARSVALQIVRDYKPDVRIAGSDGLDFYAISSFDKDPARLKANGLQDEINAWQKGQLEWQSAAPEAKAFYLRSNHDDRLMSYLCKHPELADLDVLKLPNLLELKKFGIIWEYNKDETANTELVFTRLVIRHGSLVRKHSAMTAKAEVEREFHATSLITGHTHRGGSYYVTTRAGLIQAHEAFCLCSLNPPYMQNPNWQQGLVLAEVTPNYLTVEAIPFQRSNGKVFAIWRDKFYLQG